MRKRIFVASAIGVAALLVAGGLFASNMGFKLNYVLDSPGGGSNSGSSSIGLPYFQQTNLNNAEDLINDIEAGGLDVASVARFLRSNNGFEAYTGSAGVNFPLTSGEGYIVTMAVGGSYIIVGSHNPALVINLLGPAPGVSASGTNLWSSPYHTDKADADGLCAEINGTCGPGSVSSIARWVKATDGLEAYTCTAGTNFPLAPGESYFITVAADCSFVPAHY